MRSRRKDRSRVALVKAGGRHVPAKTRLLLFVRAAGRCQFQGCNRYLLEHHVTGTEGVFAQMAHICAFSEGGPRGSRSLKGYTHDISNLMLLCAECHKLVDGHPEEYTTDVLREYKKAHENRVFELTDTTPDHHTVAIALRARVGNRPVSVSLRDMQQAVKPRYLGPRDVVEIDLTSIPDSPCKRYWQTGQEIIRSKIQGFYERIFESGPVRHVSVFALGPIPLLVYLGSQLSDKVPLTLYQRHRDTEDWRWRVNDHVVSYTLRKRRCGTEAAAVALLLSLSGAVTLSDLPRKIDERYSVYEIALENTAPDPGFLANEESLREFRRVFMGTIRELVGRHPSLRRIELFPAIPAPVAVMIGRDLSPKRDPAVFVYDYDKRAGGFVPALEVNTSGRK